MNDAVFKPAHYNQGRIEVIEFLEDQNFDFHIANAVKYLSRAGKKDASKTVEDYQKAIWYINRRIELIQTPKDTPVIRPNEMKTLSGNIIHCPLKNFETQGEENEHR